MTRCTHRLLAITFSVSTMLFVAGVPLDARAMPVSGSRGVSPTLDKNWYDRPSGPFIFFAVHEGLYRDGVANATVDRIIPPDPESGDPRMREHFVYACPLCHPAFEALRLYRRRSRPFFGTKGSRDTFGPGLPDELTIGLHSEEKAVRLGAIQKLIDRWIRQRLRRLDLTEGELAELLADMEKGREFGMSRLEVDKQRTDHDPDWQTCAICDGVVEACRDISR